MGNEIGPNRRLWPAHRPAIQSYLEEPVDVQIVPARTTASARRHFAWPTQARFFTSPKLLHAIGRKYLIRLMKGQIWGDRYWLQLCRNVEELEGARLGRGEIGIEHEGGVGLFGKAHGVAGEGGELGEE
jgi:hypothetical protein